MMITAKCRGRGEKESLYSDRECSVFLLSGCIVCPGGFTERKKCFFFFFLSASHFIKFMPFPVSVQSTGFDVSHPPACVIRLCCTS